MSTTATDLQIYLEPTDFIDCAAPEIVALARSLSCAGPTGTDHGATAIALFNWVRDNIRYDPYTAFDQRPQYRATAILARGRGYCVQKAVLLAALGRAAGIPTRLGFADVRNHKTPPHMLQMMATNLFVYHGFVEFFLDGRWIKATPAFDPAAARKAGALLVELDGTNDAMLHPVDPEGHPHIEYVKDRGSHADLPFEDLIAALQAAYRP